MFSPVAMQRMSVVILERDERPVLRGLGRLGAMHLVRTKAGPDTAPQEPPDRSADLARCDGMLVRIGTLVRRLEIEALAAPLVEPSEWSLDAAAGRLEAVETQANDMLKRKEGLRERWGYLATLAEQASAYEGVELPLEQLGQLSFLHFALGSLPAESLEELKAKVGENVVLLTMPEREGRQRLVAVTSRKGRFALETALEKSGVRRETLAVAEPGQTVKELAGEARKEKDRLEGELRQTQDAVAALRQVAAQTLADLREVVQTERLILEAEQNFPRTASTTLITGWIPRDDVPAVRRHLQEMTGGRCVVETEDPGDVPEEEIPVLLRHPRLLRPFEMLVSAYGLPGYRDIEPTLFVAITFVAMFGMMFGDVGHGSVLALGGLAAVLAGKAEKVRDVGVLLIFSGCSSIVFGALYGGYFGPREGMALWHDPLAGNTTNFLWIAVYIGIGIISLGLILNMVNRFRRGDLVGGFFDKFGVTGALFYWGVLALGLKWLVFHEKSIHWLEVVVIVVLPLTVLLLKEPILYAIRKRAGKAAGGEHGDSFFEVLLLSVIEVFETVLSYMANTISFVRLAAYAMSHAALLTATFLLAREVAKSTGAIGGAAGVVIIILGNLFAIVLEGIIASVQALRLEYYEFFGKFFSAGGRAFQPFRLASSEKKRD